MSIECARHSLIISDYYRPHHSSAGRKNFQNKSSQKTGKCYFEIGFCRHSIS